MALTPEAARADKIREARIAQVIETLCEIFGPVSIDVMFTAIARWFGMVIFNCCPTPSDRREAAETFAARIEEVITNNEKGSQGKASNEHAN